MIRSWNLLHFNFYLLQRNAHKIFNYINPFIWITQIPSVKRFYAKHGIKDMSRLIDKTVYNNADTGLNSIWAGINIGSVFVIFEYGIFNIIQAIIGQAMIRSIWENKLYATIFISGLLLIAGLFNYFTLFKKDKYQTYFKEFEKMSKNTKAKYALYCLLTVTAILGFTILSFIFVP